MELWLAFTFLCCLNFALPKPSNHRCIGQGNPEIIPFTEKCPKGGNLLDDDVVAGEGKGLLEGDIVPKPGQDGQTENRNLLIVKSRLWPRSQDGNAYVPYDDSALDDTVRAQVKKGFEEIAKVACVRFIPHTNEESRIKITQGNGCYSAVGRWGGEQPINLHPYCVELLGIVIHEMLHTLGFKHEHTRPDRDQYVKVHWENMCSGCDYNFKKAGPDYGTYGTQYDYNSLMHYHPYAASKEGNIVLEPLDSTAEPGQRIGFSQKDIQKLNVMYECDKPPPPPTTTTTTTTTTTPEPTTTTTTTPVPTTTTTEKCPNLKDDSYCNHYYNMDPDNFCDPDNSDWKQTAKFCPKTCGLCDDQTASTSEQTSETSGATTTTPATTTKEATEGTTTTAAAGCVDEKGEEYCKYYYGMDPENFCDPNSSDWRTTNQFCDKLCGRC